MKLYSYNGFCLAEHGGRVPERAAAVSEPFDPLVFLVSRDPKTSRGLFAIHSLGELDEPEGISLLLPPPEDKNDDTLARFVREHGATVANTAFSRWFPVLNAFRAR